MVATPDGFPVPPARADERAVLEGWLDFHRETLADRCAGLADDQVRLAAEEPSALTLLGLVQHLAEVERTCFQRLFAGLAVPPVYGEANADGFALDPGRGIDQALADWRAEVARGRALIADASLEDCGTLPERQAALVGDARVSLRWILLHMVTEYARHNGHADLIRELVLGATGA